MEGVLLAQDQDYHVVSNPRKTPYLSISIERHIRPLSMWTFCGNHPESFNHIFLSCDYAWTVWAPFVTYLAPFVSQPGSTNMAYISLTFMEGLADLKYP